MLSLNEHPAGPESFNMQETTFAAMIRAGRLSIGRSRLTDQGRTPDEIQRMSKHTIGQVANRAIGERLVIGASTIAVLLGGYALAHMEVTSGHAANINGVPPEAINPNVGPNSGLTQIVAPEAVDSPTTIAVVPNPNHTSVKVTPNGIK
jgi:hypothetical protein